MSDLAWFRTDPVRGIAAGDGPRVDRKAGIIYGYSVATKGFVPSHKLFFDETTMSQIEQLGQAAGDKGVKSRFTHPGMSSDGMGKMLGRSKNFRRDGDQVRADLHLSAIADKSPDGALGSYVLDLAESDPEAFGASMVVRGTQEAQLDANGDEKRGPDGAKLPPVLRIQKLMASDIVDEPAANKGLFSDDGAPDFAAREATFILDKLFGDLEPVDIRGRVDAFLDRYFAGKGTPVTDQNQTPPAATPPANNPPPAPPAAPAAAPAAAFTAPPNPSTQELILGERKRIKEVTALCQTANLSKFADQLIESGATVDQARALLFDQLVVTNKVLGGSAASDPAKPAPPADPNAVYSAEYDANAASFAKSGVTKEDYIATRLIEDGKKPLIVGEAAKTAK